ncbi:DUF2384 domain-containing protein [Pseudomonas monteilii]|uniref:DUF2384 domain-containing protein n=2 Tax=Pseudomonas monteilii TaxID=76759 RepID=A0A399M667_9PSED|nr:DUF2384 domain-containing protein [Pseudomonas monteilii]
MDHSERVWLLAEQVLGDKVKAAIWLSLPRADFDGCSAAEILGERNGCQRVIELLERLLNEHAGCTALAKATALH